MMTHEILNLLTNMSKRLATLADQAHETREQAQHTLDRIYLLCEDVDRLKRRILSNPETDGQVPMHSEARR